VQAGASHRRPRERGRELLLLIAAVVTFFLEEYKDTGVIAAVLLWEGVLHVADHFAREGLRVLGMAYKEVVAERSEITREDLRTGLIFAGLQGMIDPLRPSRLLISA